MKKAGAKGKGKSKPIQKEEVTSPEIESEPVDIAVVRQNATNLIGREAALMLKAVINECKKGQYQSLKYLFEVAGIFPATADAPQEHEPSFAEFLCKQLGLPEEMPEEEVTNDTLESEEPVKHTVE
jgi:hypothetical protein